MGSVSNIILSLISPIKSLLLCFKVTWLPLFGVAYIRSTTTIKRRHRNAETNPKSAFTLKWHNISSDTLKLFSKSPEQIPDGTGEGPYLPLLWRFPEAKPTQSEIWKVHHVQNSILNKTISCRYLIISPKVFSLFCQAMNWHASPLHDVVWAPIKSPEEEL